MCKMERTGLMEEISFENVDGRTADGRTDDELSAYSISSPMSLWLR